MPWSVRAFALRTVLLAALFWVMAEGRPGGAPLPAAAVILAAAAASLALLPEGRFRFRAVGLLRFVPWFVFEAVRGGVDVASRALRPELPLEPGYFDYEIGLPTSAARVFFTNTVSLLPGTLSIALREDVLRIHALDVRQPLHDRLRRLEEKVAGLFAAT